jgi:hypothetical protein
MGLNNGFDRGINEDPLFTEVTIHACHRHVFVSSPVVTAHIEVQSTFFFLDSASKP